LLQKGLGAAIGDLHQTQIADAFRWPFYAGGPAALLAFFPALLTGRRLGQHAGITSCRAVSAVTPQQHPAARPQALNDSLQADRHILISPSTTVEFIDC
jgi:hypothetical protein